MKNHIKVNGKLLQTNKRFSQLKESQKNWIVPELYNLYHKKMKEICTTGKLSPHHRDTVISSLYEQIRDREIWIPYDKVKKYTFGTTAKMVEQGPFKGLRCLTYGKSHHRMLNYLIFYAVYEKDYEIDLINILPARSKRERKK